MAVHGVRKVRWVEETRRGDTAALGIENHQNVLGILVISQTSRNLIPPVYFQRPILRPSSRRDIDFISLCLLIRPLKPERSAWNYLLNLFSEPYCVATDFRRFR